MSDIGDNCMEPGTCRSFGRCRYTGGPLADCDRAIKEERARKEDQVKLEDFSRSLAELLGREGMENAAIVVNDADGNERDLKVGGVIEKDGQKFVLLVVV